MPKRLRISTGGLAYHVINRAAGRGRIFDADADYAAMERVIERTHKILPIRIVSYCLMPNHWHLVLWPKKDGQLSEFMRLLTVTHAQRWHAHRGSVGTGPLYQGRFKSLPIQQDEHFLTVCRYVERNALRANLVQSAGGWRWCSLGRRNAGQSPEWLLGINRWPVDAPSDWPAWVERPETAAELAAMRECVKRGRPFGNDQWTARTAKRLDLESTMRPRGRRRIHSIKDSRSL